MDKIGHYMEDFIQAEEQAQHEVRGEASENTEPSRPWTLIFHPIDHEPHYLSNASWQQKTKAVFRILPHFRDIKK